MKTNITTVSMHFGYSLLRIAGALFYKFISLGLVIIKFTHYYSLRIIRNATKKKSCKIFHCLRCEWLKC